MASSGKRAAGAFAQLQDAPLMDISPQISWDNLASADFGSEGDGSGFPGGMSEPAVEAILSLVQEHSPEPTVARVDAKYQATANSQVDAADPLTLVDFDDNPVGDDVGDWVKNASGLFTFQKRANVRASGMISCSPLTAAEVSAIAIMLWTVDGTNVQFYDFRYIDGTNYAGDFCLVWSDIFYQVETGDTLQFKAGESAGTEGYNMQARQVSLQFWDRDD